MGHLQDVDKARVGLGGRKAPTVWRFVRDVWQNRIQRAVMDEY